MDGKVLGNQANAMTIPKNTKIRLAPAKLGLFYTQI